MASTSRTILTRCTCGVLMSGGPSTSSRAAVKSIEKTARSIPASKAASTSSAKTHRVRPPQRWVMPNFAMRKKAAHLPAPRAQKFENKITLPDGSVTSIFSTSPRANIAVTKHTSNHPLWAFASAGDASRMGGMQDDEGGRMGRFARKFGGNKASSITPGQERVIQKMDQAATPLESSELGATAANKVAEESAKDSAITGKTEKTAKKGTETAAAADDSTPQNLAPDGQEELFDLSLEGEVVEELKHQVVEDGKKGKKGAAKKGGKK